MQVSCKESNSKGIMGTNPDESNIQKEKSQVATEGKLAEMNFEAEDHDFGNISQGDKVVHDFEFKNSSQNDLIITDAKGSCGCTIPEYPKEPVKAGDTGIIKVSFNSAGKIGKQAKSVTIYANVQDGQKILHITSNIVSKETN